MLETIVSTAAYMTYDQIKKWVYYNDNKTYGEIKAKINDDHSDIILYRDATELTTMYHNVKYVAKGSFHQWRQNDKVHALKFKTKEFAAQWDDEIMAMISQLKNAYAKKRGAGSRSQTIDIAKYNEHKNNKKKSDRISSDDTESIDKVSDKEPSSSAKPPPPKRMNSIKPSAPLRNIPVPIAPPPPPPPMSSSQPIGSINEPPISLESNVPKAPPPPCSSVPPAPNGVPPPPPPPSASSLGANNNQPPNLLDAIKNSRLSQLKPSQKTQTSPTPTKAPGLSMMEEMQLRLNKRKVTIEKNASNDDITKETDTSSKTHGGSESNVSKTNFIFKPPTSKNDTSTSSVAKPIFVPYSSNKPALKKPNESISREEFEKFKQDIIDTIKNEIKDLKQEILDELRK